MSVTASRELAALFPPGAVVFETHTPGDVARLLPAEAACLRLAGADRAAEFAAGRACARAALSVLGIEGFALRAASDRQPLWPEGIVGSITHTDHYCAVVVAVRREIAALGIDCESARAVGEKLWTKIAVPAERDWLGALASDERDAGAALVFSAKEAFYKCRYPTSATRFGFHDVSIRLYGPLRGAGAFSIDIEGGSEPIVPPGHALVGRYRFCDGRVTTAITTTADIAAGCVLP
jgi:enterobactin synthetase component D / holo-[acyl-carrier protein] synthase